VAEIPYKLVQGMMFTILLITLVEVAFIIVI
jgi:hypothetical protein